MVMAIERGQTAVAARWDGAELFRYTYRPDDPQAESPRPYFHPVRTLAGVLVTDCRPGDHPWHKGIAWSLPHVGSENFWGGPTYRRVDGYVWLDNNGAMRHEGFDLVSTDDDAARLDERLTWVTAAGQPLFTERRQIAVTAWPDVSAWRLSFQTMMRNVSGGQLSIGSPTTEGRDNAGYGGLFWRGPASYTGGTVLTPDRAGGDELMGWRGPWLGFTAGSATLIFRDSPANPGSGCQWFVRSTPFACICPAPFFAVACEVPAGGSLSLRYDVIVADGELDPVGCGLLAGRKGYFDRTNSG
jgi:hypothetical protein